jgi:hypothetical protein
MAIDIEKMKLTNDAANAFYNDLRAVIKRVSATGLIPKATVAGTLIDMGTSIALLDDPDWKPVSHPVKLPWLADATNAS